MKTKSAANACKNISADANVILVLMQNNKNPSAARDGGGGGGEADHFAAGTLAEKRTEC